MAKERISLGTGLSALFGEEPESSEKITVLPITKIEPRSEQPRTVFDEEALQSLSESISRHGIIQPITVRKLNNGYYQIIAGERRWRAARMAGLREVPVSLIEADDKKTAELALVENLQREDLNPIEEALGYKTLIEEYNLTQEEAAETVGKSRSAVTNSLRLLNLSPAVMELVEKNSLSAGHARALIPITDATVQLETAGQIIEKGLSVRSAERLAQELIRNTEKEKEKEKAENESELPDSIDYVKELSSELSKKLGRKVSFTFAGKNKKNGSNGRIELEFYGEEDREKLIDLLRKL